MRISDWSSDVCSSDLENRTSSHHVAARIARIAPLLYVDSPGMRKPDGSRRDLKRGLRKLLAAFRRPIHVEGNLWHCTVPQLPFRGIPGMNAFNRWFGQFAVRRAMRAIGLAECISWLDRKRTRLNSSH